MALIDKSAIVAEIEKRIKETKSMQPKFDQFWAGQISAFKGILKILDTLEIKDVDLEKESMNYLLNEHKSPLTKVMHGVDLGTEMQYHKDIQDAFKAGFKKAVEG